MKNKLVHDALILTIITVISGAILGAVYGITKDPIAKANEKTLVDSYKAVFEDMDSYDEVKGFDKDTASKAAHDAGFTDDDITGCVIAKDKDGNELGYVIGVESHKGYGGTIDLSMGVDTDGNCTGYSLTSISETPGLGMHATDTGKGSFAEQFKGLANGEYKVTKDGGEIQAISGATITSRAMTNAINAGFAYYNTIEGGSQ